MKLNIKSLDFSDRWGWGWEEALDKRHQSKNVQKKFDKEVEEKEFTKTIDNVSAKNEIIMNF